MVLTTFDGICYIIAVAGLEEDDKMKLKELWDKNMVEVKEESLQMMETLEFKDFKKWRLKHCDSEGGMFDLINDFLEFRREKHLHPITTKPIKKA